MRKVMCCVAGVIVFAIPQDSWGRESKISLDRPAECLNKSPGIDTFRRELDIANRYAESNKFRLALAHYKNASNMPHEWGADQQLLTYGIERALGHVPMDAEGHMCLGRTFAQARVIGGQIAPPGDLAQGKVEYEQAVALSGIKLVPEAQQYLQHLARLSEESAQHWKPATPEQAQMTNQIESYKHRLVSRWNPPVGNGYLLTRCHVFVSNAGRLTKCKLVVTSGNAAFDKSVLTALKADSSTIFEPDMSGMYDLGFSARGPHKDVALTVSASIVDLK